MTSSLDPSGRYQRLQRLTLNYLSLWIKKIQKKIRSVEIIY
jgi:hypothetical protein